MKRRVKTMIGSKNCDDPVIDYKSTEYLEKFLTPQGQILSRRRTASAPSARSSSSRPSSVLVTSDSSFVG